MYLTQSATAVAVQAPAKLNLFLEILARRNDGYHEIETLMVPITIFDTFRFSTTAGNQIRLTCRWSYGLDRSAIEVARRNSVTARETGGVDSQLGDLPTGSDNIVVKAVELFRRKAGVSAGATIHLIKRIPSAAGLGGASSDAAAALVAANRAWGVGWTDAELAELSSEVGSDIPFFFTMGPAVCRGRGERVKPVALPRLYVVVVKPPVGLSTPSVFKACEVPQYPRSLDGFLEGSTSRVGGDVSNRLSRICFNRLQDPASRLSPWIKRLSQDFERTGCLQHQMSGSGSSYFGLCRNARHARRVASRLRAEGHAIVYCASSFSARPLRR